MKWRPDPTGDWRVENLGKDPKITKEGRLPAKPPQFVTDRAREFEEKEYRARHGLGAAPARVKGLAGYLAGYLEAFKATHKAGSARQLGRHAENFRAYLEGKGVTSVQGVTKSHCRDYLESRLADVSHDTLKTEKRYLSPIWTRAVEDGLMMVNPWSHLKVPGRSTRSDPVFWDEAEIARIAEACSKSWQTDLVYVLAYTGLRISTALAMTWSWLDWQEGTITIPREIAARADGVKTAYTFALTGKAREVLERRRFSGRGELVFPNPHRGGGVVPYDSAREAIMRAIRKAGVKAGTAHDLRHSYARLLDRAGIPASFVQVQLGHTNAATTRIYTEARPAEVARFLEGFGLSRPEAGRPGGDPDPSPPPT